MKLPLGIPLGLIAAILSTACATSSTSESGATADATSTSARPEGKGNLRKGMSESEIRAAWGDPVAAHPGNAGERYLVYRFDVRTTQRMVATSMKEVPNYDPITGESKPVKEPVFSPQNVTVTQTLVLTLRDDRLESWARRLDEERRFN